jgi:hypothetical protein
MKPGGRRGMFGEFAMGPYNFYTGIINFLRSKERVCGEWEGLKIFSLRQIDE